MLYLKNGNPKQPLKSEDCREVQASFNMLQMHYSNTIVNLKCWDFLKVLQSVALWHILIYQEY